MSGGAWTVIGPNTADALGYLPDIFRGDDPRPAKEQANDRYRHGGGWCPQAGWVIDPVFGTAIYSGDPELAPIAICTLSDTETLMFYPYAYVAILNEDGSYEMARMD